MNFDLTQPSFKRDNLPTLPPTPPPPRTQNLEGRKLLVTFLLLLQTTSPPPRNKTPGFNEATLSCSICHQCGFKFLTRCAFCLSPFFSKDPQNWSLGINSYSKRIHAPPRPPHILQYLSFLLNPEHASCNSSTYYLRQGASLLTLVTVTPYDNVRKMVANSSLMDAFQKILRTDCIIIKYRETGK